MGVVHEVLSQDLNILRKQRAADLDRCSAGESMSSPDLVPRI